MKRLPKCPTTGKVRFRDEIAAKLALASTAAKDGPKRAKSERRVYRCPLCQGWHLTSHGKPPE